MLQEEVVKCCRIELDARRALSVAMPQSDDAAC
jgi:hypothetical protein